MKNEKSSKQMTDRKGQIEYTELREPPIPVAHLSRKTHLIEDYLEIV